MRVKCPIKRRAKIALIVILVNKNPSTAVIMIRTKTSRSNVVDTNKYAKMYLPNNSCATPNKNIPLKNVAAITKGLLNYKAIDIPVDKIKAAHAKTVICCRYTLIIK